MLVDVAPTTPVKARNWVVLLLLPLLLLPHPLENRTLKESEKIIVAVVSTSNGVPLSRYGRYFHCFTASIAAPVSRGSPETRSTDFTSPVVPMSNFRTTWP